MREPAGLPTISIVTCSLNQSAFIEAAIRSVLDQDYPALEYIIVDGGSTDGTVEIIKRYQDRLAWWVSEPDSGHTDALIKGFRRSTGEIMGWLCSSDVLLPGALSAVARELSLKRDIDALYGDLVRIDENDRVLGYKKEIGFRRFIWLWSYNYIPQPSMFWRRGIYERVGGLDASYRLAMDGELWERFSRSGRVGHFPKVLALARKHPGQVNVRFREQSDAEDARYRLRSLGRPARPLEILLRRAAARAARVGLKILNGCYGRCPPRYVRELLSERNPQ